MLIPATMPEKIRKLMKIMWLGCPKNVGIMADDAVSTRYDHKEAYPSTMATYHICVFKVLHLCRMVVGQTLQILGPDENSKDKYQWYQIDLNGDWLLISGATRNQVEILFSCPLF